MVVFDAGNLYSKSARVPEAQRAEAFSKATLIAEAVKLGAPDGLNVATGDLAFGLAWLKETSQRLELPTISANLSCSGEAPFPPGRVVERAGLRIGVVGVAGKDVDSPGCVAGDPVPAVQAAIQSLGAADFWVVLSGGRNDEDQRLLDAVPEINLLINGEERKEHLNPRATAAGDLRLAAGSRGKKLGVLEVRHLPGATRFRDVGAYAQLAEKKDKYTSQIAELTRKLTDTEDGVEAARLQRRLDYYGKELKEVEAELAAASANSGPAHESTHRLLELDATVTDDPATAALITALKDELSRGAPVVDTLATATGPFVGSAACAGCHGAQTAQWSTTPHAAAYTSLVAQNRHRDSDCYTCHVTGALHPDGPKSAFAVRGLEGVGCESCHGAGREHAANPGAVRMNATPAETACTSCHDGVKDEGRFDPASYLPKVRHSSTGAPTATPPTPPPAP